MGWLLGRRFWSTWTPKCLTLCRRWWHFIQRSCVVAICPEACKENIQGSGLVNDLAKSFVPCIVKRVCLHEIVITDRNNTLQQVLTSQLPWIRFHRTWSSYHWLASERGSVVITWRHVFLSFFRRHVVLPSRARVRLPCPSPSDGVPPLARHSAETFWRELPPHDWQVEGVRPSLDGIGLFAIVPTGNGKTSYFTMYILVVLAVSQNPPPLPYHQVS